MGISVIHRVACRFLLCASCGLLWAACDGETAARNAKLSHTHYLLGDDYFTKKQVDAAKSELVRAIELDAKNSDAHRLLGFVFFLEGVHAVDFKERTHCLTGPAAGEQEEAANDRFRRAEEHFRRVVALRPKDEKLDPDVLNWLANIALHFKRYDEAILLMDQGLGDIVYGYQHFLLSTRGWAFYEKGELDRAARDLRQSLFHQPQFCVGRYRLAKVYYEQKNYDGALAELKELSREAACPLQEVYELSGLVAMHLRRSEDARQAFEQCVSAKPRSCIAQACARYGKLL